MGGPGLGGPGREKGRLSGQQIHTRDFSWPGPACRAPGSPGSLVAGRPWPAGEPGLGVALLGWSPLRPPRRRCLAADPAARLRVICRLGGQWEGVAPARSLFLGLQKLPRHSSRSGRCKGCPSARTGGPVAPAAASQTRHRGASLLCTQARFAPSKAGSSAPPTRGPQDQASLWQNPDNAGWGCPHPLSRLPWLGRRLWGNCPRVTHPRLDPRPLR